MITGTVIDYRHCRTSETHIYRANIFDCSTDTLCRLNRIGGVHDNHTRNGAHQSDIFVTLMARTILADGDAGMACADFYVQMRIADRVTDLFVSTACCKHGKGARHRNFPNEGKSCCHAHHICLCDTAVKMTVRKALFKHSSLCRCGQICVQHYQLRMFLSQLYQSFPEGFSGRNLLYF